MRESKSFAQPELICYFCQPDDPVRDGPNFRETITGFFKGFSVAFVRISQVANLDEVTSRIHEALSAPTVRAGQVVVLDPALVSRVEQQVLERSAAALLEVRRRERATPAELLAFQLI